MRANGDTAVFINPAFCGVLTTIPQLEEEAKWN